MGCLQPLMEPLLLKAFLAQAISSVMHPRLLQLVVQGWQASSSGACGHAESALLTVHSFSVLLPQLCCVGTSCRGHQFETVQLVVPLSQAVS